MSVFAQVKEMSFADAREIPELCGLEPTKRSFVLAVAKARSEGNPLKLPRLVAIRKNFTDALKSRDTWPVRSFVSAAGDYFLDGSNDDRAVLTTSMSFETTMKEHINL